jgi:myosin XVIII
VEKANPEFLDFCEDISQLKYLNETSVLNSLRQRYANNLIHTYAGAKNLLVINSMIPMMSLYSEKVVSMFRGCKADFGILDMPPHIYSLSKLTQEGRKENINMIYFIFSSIHIFGNGAD